MKAVHRTHPDLIAHGISAERWAKRWGIEIPEPWPCYDCGAPQVCSLPFVRGKLRGLKAPPCQCGRTHGPWCVVHSQGLPIEQWPDIAGN